MGTVRPGADAAGPWPAGHPTRGGTPGPAGVPAATVIRPIGPIRERREFWTTGGLQIAMRGENGRGLVYLATGTRRPRRAGPRRATLPDRAPLARGRAAPSPRSASRSPRRPGRCWPGRRWPHRLRPWRPGTATAPGRRSDPVRDEQWQLDELNADGRLAARRPAAASRSRSSTPGWTPATPTWSGRCCPASTWSTARRTGAPTRSGTAPPWPRLIAGRDDDTRGVVGLAPRREDPAGTRPGRGEPVRRRR